MKLELKHLSPYLPYRLKCYEPRFNTQHTIIGLVNNEVYIGDEDEIFSFVLDNETLPILRPLSDLKEFSPAIYNYLIKNCENYVVRLQQIDYNVLIENHFDVFKLIEKGLAIDINSLPQSSE